MSQIEISKRLVMINSASAVLTRIITVGSALWLPAFLIRKTSPEEFNVYVLVQTLLLFIPLLSMAVGAGLTRFVTEAYARGDQRRVTQIVSTLAPLCLATATLVLVAGLLLTWRIDSVLTIAPDFATDAQIMFGILVLLAAVRIGSMPFLIGIQVKQKFVWMHLTGLLAQLMWLAGILVLLLGVSPNVVWVAVASIPSTLFDVGITIHLSRRLMPALRWRLGEYRRELVQPLLSFGGWTMIARVASVAREACGVLILNEFPRGRVQPLRIENANAFRMGALAETRLFPLALMPLSTTLPALTAMYATGQGARLRHAFFRMSRMVLWAFLLPAIPLIVFHHELMLLYLGAAGLAEVSAAPMVMVLLLAKAIVVFPQPVMAQLVAARNQTRPMAIRVVILEALTVGATLYAVAFHDFGAVGAAAVTLGITAVGHPLLHWTLGLQLTGSTWGQWIRETLIPGAIPGIAAAATCLGTRWLSVPDTWLELGLHATVSSLAYFAALVLFCLQPTERADLNNVLNRTRRLFGRGTAAG